MRYLLDTHALIWSQDDTSRLPATVVALLSDPAHDRLLSLATCWEIGIKVSLGKLSLSKPYRPWIDTASADMILTDLPISLNHIERLLTLPLGDHRDPFDRILAAQALYEDVPIISNDDKFDAYGVSRIWN